MQQFKIRFFTKEAKNILAGPGRDNSTQSISDENNDTSSHEDFRTRRRKSMEVQNKFFPKVVHRRNQSSGPAQFLNNFENALDFSTSLDELIEQIQISKIKSNQAKDVELSDWEPLLKKHRYTVNKVLGQGSFGMVAKGYCYHNKCEVAIKKLTNFASDDYDCLRVLREIQIMKKLNQQPGSSKHVPKLYDVIVCKETNSVFIVMEYFWTDLRRLIDYKIAKLSKNRILRLIHSLLSAAQFLHQCNIIHRDVKPDNIYVTKDLQVKIGDYGLSRNLPESLIGKGSCNSLRVRNFMRKQSNEYDKNFEKEETKIKFASKVQSMVDCMSQRDRVLTDYFGSRWYRAPEILLVQKQYDQAQDMWSIGCIIFEILNAAYPNPFCSYGYDAILFRGHYCDLLSEGMPPQKDLTPDMKEQIRVIIDQLPKLEPLDLSFIDREDYKKLEKIKMLTADRSQHLSYMNRLATLPEEMTELLDNLLKFNPYMRWSAKECLEMPVFQKHAQNSELVDESWLASPQKIFLMVDKDKEHVQQHTVKKLLKLIYAENDHPMIQIEKTKLFNNQLQGIKKFNE